jgi:hypothetical protein
MNIKPGIEVRDPLSPQLKLSPPFDLFFLEISTSLVPPREVLLFIPISDGYPNGTITSPPS